MAVNVASKCWILALFIRDDGERLVLGDGAYDFKDKQQHFTANAMVNDTIDVQGNDGTLIAGQVRRASTQSFDGYIGDATASKPEVETYRRAFISFFAKNHFYKVIYVLPDGSAVKRQRGFIVDAPEVKELWQIHPEYHVALNFEDVNYYNYNENEDGEEIYSQIVQLAKSGTDSGGLVWDEVGAVNLGMDMQTATASGTTIEITDAAIFPPTDFRMDGDTVQDGTPTPSAPVEVQTVSGENTITITGESGTKSLLLNLGDIELCKIGTAQDYIYRQNGSWWLHKETSRFEQISPTINGLSISGPAGESQVSEAGAFSYIYNQGTNNDVPTGQIYCNYLKWQDQDISGNQAANTMVDGTCTQRSGTNDRLYFRDTSLTGRTGSQCASIMQNLKFYYILATPTDTEITAPTLVGQLDTILTTSLYSDQNTITTQTANLAPNLSLTYMVDSDEPGGFEWEEGGNASITIVQNNSIDYVYPVITINGPASNPTVENVTTGQTISYNGTISAEQTLIIDATAQTAKLNGLNVISNLEGSWLHLAPGDNRLTYVSDDADTPPATLEWSEVVG